MEYPWGKFGDGSFNRFGFNVRTDGQTDRITGAAECLTPATVVAGASNDDKLV